LTARPTGRPRKDVSPGWAAEVYAYAREILTVLGGRWHDNRHTFITDLAESGQASDETIRDLAGHVSKQMLKHYSHIRMEAKRRAVDSLTVNSKADEKSKSVVVSVEALQEVPKVGDSAKRRMPVS